MEILIPELRLPLVGTCWAGLRLGYVEHHGGHLSRAREGLSLRRPYRPGRGRHLAYERTENVEYARYTPLCVCLMY
jgi:hypothetical protein